MSEPNPCRACPSAAVVVLSVLLAFAVVGWVATAMSKPDSVPVVAAVAEPVAELPPALPPVPAPVETVAVPVAARDIPVGTMFAAGDLDRLVTTKAVPKDALPPGFVVAAKELAGKRAARTIRAGEPFPAGDLTRGGVVTIPPDHHMISASIGCPVAKSGVVGPGAVVDVAALVRVGGTPRPITILADALVLAVDTESGVGWPIYSFAVDRKQALLMELAKMRADSLLLVRRDAKEARREGYNIDTVTQFLSELAFPSGFSVPPAAPKPPPGLALPAGTVAVSVEFLPNGVAGFIVPGSWADVLATVRADNKLRAFPILVSVLVVAVDTQSDPNGGVTKVTVTFAVDKPQAAVLALALAKKCALMPLLRSPDGDKKDDGYDIKEVTKFLSAIPDAELPVAPPPRAK